MPQNHVFKQGSVIGGYELEKFIGSGGSAEVWQVADKDGKLFAMKIFSPAKGMDEAGIGFFKKEFAKTLNLDHPNILSGIKYGEFNRRPYILFDLCTTSLMNKIRNRLVNPGSANFNRYTESEIAMILYDVVNALNYLHKNEIIHQDIKPDNILILSNLNGRDRFLISDFGVSTKIKKTIMQETQLLVSGRNGLSPDYAAPEQFKGQAVTKSDIFSLGVTLYELCEGETPSKSNYAYTAEALQNGGEIPDISEYYSKRLNLLIKSCMSLKPDDRPGSAQILTWTQFYLDNGYWPADTGKSKKTIIIPIENKKRMLFYLLLTFGFLVVLLTLFMNYSPEKRITNMMAEYRYEEAYEVALNNSNNKKVSELLSKLEFLKNNVVSVKPVLDDYSIFKSKREKYGVIKGGIEIVIKDDYDLIYPFYLRNIITVKNEEKCGYIDIEGNVLYGEINYNTCEIIKNDIEYKQFLKNLQK
jgi:serine/threonine protein kinase